MASKYFTETWQQLNNRLSLIIRKEYDRQANFQDHLTPCTAATSRNDAQYSGCLYIKTP